MKSKARKTLLFAGCIAATVALLCSCSPQAQSAGDQADKKEAGAIEVEWSPEADCAACHSTEQSSYDDAACLASFHKQQACASCHADDQALSNAHVGKTSADKAPKRLKKTEVSDELCLSCHFGTKEELVAATQDVVVTDENGTSRNPHDGGDIAEHESIECSSCHSMHSDEPVSEQAYDTCISCHHAGVFECYTCHE